MFEVWCGSSEDGFLGTCDHLSYDSANQAHIFLSAWHYFIIVPHA